MNTMGDYVHKDTKKILFNVKRTGRHYTSSRSRQTSIRYCGQDSNHNPVKKTPQEFKKYVQRIKVGHQWYAGGATYEIVSAVQKTKLTAMVKIEVSFSSGPRKGHGWYEEELQQGIVA